jgi:signal transduction histidine kinase
MSYIVVLDDRPADRELLTTVLGHAGYEVREACTGDEALELAHAEPPDLIITDILMPAMNGFEFVRRLRSDPHTNAIPVVFCTANYLEGEVKDLAAACGVSHFILKPSDPGAIVSTVGDVLGSTRTLPRPLANKAFDREQLRLLNDKLVEKVGELEAANAERRKLIGELVTAHEDERERIAGELHDDTIQAVLALGMRLDMLAERAIEPEIAGALGRLRKEAALAVEGLRRLLSGLQPVELAGQGLATGLEVCLKQARERDGLKHGFVDRTTREPSEATRTLLYRAGREALANVRKHAGASRVEVLLDERTEGYSLVVRDNGKGFDVEQGLRVRPGHLGLPEMRERVEIAGGRMTLTSRSGSGAAVEVWLPELDPEGVVNHG